MTSDPPTMFTESELEIAAEGGVLDSQVRLEQQYRWRALADAYLIRFDRHPDRLLLTYEARPAVRTEVSDLIRTEEQASPFLTWIMVDDDEGLTILIQGNEQLLNSLDPIIRNDFGTA